MEEPSEKEDLDNKESEKHIGLKKILLGLVLVVVGNLYMYVQTFSNGILFDFNTIIGLIIVIIGFYIIFK